MAWARWICSNLSALPAICGDYIIGFVLTQYNGLGTKLGILAGTAASVALGLGLGLGLSI